MIPDAEKDDVDGLVYEADSVNEGIYLCSQQFHRSVIRRRADSCQYS